jgi:hypothetical protein
MKPIFCVLAMLCFGSRVGAFDTWWHAECTRVAMTQNGFSADARLATQVSNYITDFLSVVSGGNEYLEAAGVGQMRLTIDASYEYLHFDAVFGAVNIEHNWAVLYKNTISTLQKYSSLASLEPGFRQIVLFNILGASLHVVQDFYSHSNWVNLYAERGKTAPIWFDVPQAERLKMNLETGAYPAGSAPGHADHDTLNKDSTGRQYNTFAVETATRASADWVQRIVTATPNIWVAAKSYTVQNDPVLKRFLYSLDATFLTSSSIVAQHFDGETPARFIFAPSKDVAVERRIALQALLQVLNAYAVNIAQASNKYKLPSPYWVGFLGYGITKDLARGLIKNDKPFQ